MKQNKERLFEIMNKVAGMPLNENFDSEKDIINDILSINEGENNILNKLINYGKRGLLTASIIIAVAGSPEAKENKISDDVIKHGIEYVDDKEDKIELYNLIIGAALAGNETVIDAFQSGGDINDERFDATSEVITYFDLKKQGKTPPELSNEAKKVLNVIYDMLNSGQITPQLMEKFINDGKNINISFEKSTM